MAACGLALNVVIGHFYSPEILGAFNQVFAMYIVLSQIAVFGIHYSVGKFIPQHSLDSEKQKKLSSAALGLVLISSTLVTAISFLATPYLGFLFDSNLVGKMWSVAFWGLVLFSINKVLLSLLNGHRYMKVFAFLQSIRYVALSVFIFFCGWTQQGPQFVAFSLVFAEIVLLLMILPFAVPLIHWQTVFQFSHWYRLHFSFGFYSMMSGAVIELNTRVDVLILGFFLSDEKVGIYSVALLAAEGLFQMSVALRSNFNPVISQLFFTDQKEKLLQYVKQKIKLSYIIFVPVALLSAVIYKFVVQRIFGDAYLESVVAFNILLFFLFLSFGLAPFSMYLLQVGKPKLNTFLQVVTLIVNVIGNIVLVHYYDFVGAAIGTGISYLVNAILVYYFIFRKKF